MIHYTEIARFTRDGFDIIVDRRPEDMHPGDSFDGTVYNIADICRQIDLGHMEWFQLRVRAMVQGHTLGTSTLAGCLYAADSVTDVLVDGTAEDGIWDALNEARQAVLELLPKLQQIHV